MSAYIYDSYGRASDAELAGVVLMYLVIFALISYAIIAFLTGRLFKKAGIPQWKAWVPVYNTWTLLKMGDQSGWWAVVAMVPFLGIISAIFAILAMHTIGKKLGKESWFVLIAIFIPVLWLIWLGFDDSKWPTKKSKAKKSTKK